MRDVTGHGAPARRTSALGYFRDLILTEGGSISFEHFMREALYHPRFGYYARQVGTIGRGGDFSTSATLHGSLGTAIGAWATDRRAVLPARAHWHVIELGGGNGQMADGVLRAFGWWVRRGVSYHLVERSQVLRREQQDRLARWPMVSWHDEIDSALHAARGEALIFSNEFVDAFPVVRLEWDGAASWRELGVIWQAETGSLIEQATPWDESSDVGDALGASVFASEYTAGTRRGQRVEWHREYARWLQRWNSLWRKGAMLTIDYGDLLSALYHRRPEGTLRGYHRHIRSTGLAIYARPGQQDLTADVNFTDLLRWGTTLGMMNAGLTTQTDFLTRWLPSSYARRHERDPAYRFLTDPAGAGSAFKVLEQHRS